MRRYYFHIRIGDELGEDDEGADLPNLEAVQRKALRALAESAEGLIEFPLSLVVKVRDADCSVMNARVVFDLHRQLKRTAPT
jgi:uncharacterized protein DUF6894